MNQVTLLESAYFHINNGGLTLRVTEEKDGDDSENPEEATTLWKLHVTMGVYGSEVGFNFPLTQPIVEWSLGTLSRVYNRMLSCKTSKEYTLQKDPLVTCKDGSSQLPRIEKP